MTLDNPSNSGGAVESGKSQPVAKGTRLGAFEVIEVIGQRRLGIVYLAFDHNLRRRVAIKEYIPAALAYRLPGRTVVLRSAAHEKTFRAGMRTFIDEAHVLTTFDHPALLKVFSCWEQHGTAYMAMRFYEGKTLQLYLREHSKRDETWLKALLWPLLDGLEALHRAERYHRDVSPENIIVLDDGSPVLLDLGGACRIIDQMTQGSTVDPKAGFAPLEQYANDRSSSEGPWTDIYSVAAVLRFAITGKPPSVPVARVFTDAMKPLLGATSGYSDAFLRGIDGALAVRPEQRPQSIAEFRESLGMTVRPDATVTPGLHGPAATHVEPNDDRNNSGVSSTPALKQDVPRRGMMAAPSPVLKKPHPPTVSSPVNTELPGSTTVRPAPESPDLNSRSAPHFSAAKVDDGPAGTGEAAAALPTAPIRRKVLWKIAVPLLLIVSVVLGVLLWSQSDSEEQVQAGATHADQAVTRDSPEPAATHLAGTATTGSDAATPDVRTPGLQTPSSSAKVARTLGDGKSALQENYRAGASSEPTSPIKPAPPPMESSAPPSPLTGPRTAAKMSTAIPEADRAAPSGTKASPPARTGRLRFHITPWGDIFIDGKHYQASPPLKEVILPEGRHRVEIRNAQFAAHVAEVEVTPGARISIIHTFK